MVVISNWFQQALNYVLYKEDRDLSAELNFIAKEINKSKSQS